MNRRIAAIIGRVLREFAFLAWIAACPAAEIPDRQAAAEIDALIEADLAAQKIQPDPPCDDATFVRRAWIDLGGRIPTAAEAVAFIDDRDAAKRSRLPGTIAASAAWEMAQFAWMADLLRVQSRLQDRTPGQAWIDWLKAAIHQDRPWDAMVRDMVVATGHAFDPDGGATGWILRDTGMPLDHAALSTQTFLATRIGCAQCHDHPFDSWTRLDFLRFAAFSADERTETRAEGAKDMKQELADAAPEVRNAARNLATVLGARVEAGRKDWLPVPKDYQYDDVKKGSHVVAAALFSPAATVPASGDARAALAGWMTAADNPRFALAIGNRLWKRCFGLGLIEPVDDIHGAPDKPLPPLPTRLAKLVVDCGFDLRRVQLVLCSTRHWQRAAWSGALPAGGGVVPGRPVARLGAQVWWDALVTLAADDPETRGTATSSPLQALRAQLQGGGAQQIIAVAERVAAQRKPGAKGAPEDPEAAAIAEALRPSPKKQAGRAILLRAAEMPQPAPPGHPLRVLGQSDRELVDNASNEPTATQALLLMNGIVDAEILVPRSRLMRDLAAITDPPARIERLWLAVLSRRPSPAEREHALAELKTRAQAGLQDVAWALINGSEFRIVP